jgi:hypothetical protein
LVQVAGDVGPSVTKIECQSDASADDYQSFVVVIFVDAVKKKSTERQRENKQNKAQNKAAIIIHQTDECWIQNNNKQQQHTNKQITKKQTVETLTESLVIAWVLRSLQKILRHPHPQSPPPSPITTKT